MKISSIILLATLVLMITAMYASNIVLKKEYDRIDKSDIYWTYDKILEKPFRHLHITGGNITNIAFEQNKNCSVRTFKNWNTNDGRLTLNVSHDTLYLNFSNAVKNIYEKQYLSWITPVRIFAPQLLSVTGSDTKFGLFKLKQKNITIHLSGKSMLEVESYFHDLDSLDITQSDSSTVQFEVSPDLAGKNYKGEGDLPAVNSTRVSVKSGGIIEAGQPVKGVMPQSWETLHINNLKADLKGTSILDVGHAQIDSLHLTITDTSAIILSGQALRQFHR